MRASAPRAALVGGLMVAGLFLAACSGATVAETSESTDAMPSTSTPSPAVSVTAAPPTSWAEVTPEATASPTSDEADPDDSPDDLEGDVEGELLEDWQIGDARVSLGTEPNPDGVVDPDAYFEDRFGDLGPSDGLDIAHSSSTTSEGAPLLIVDVEPAAGQGGDAQTLVYILGADTIVSGALTYDGSLDQALRSQLIDRAEAVEIGS